MSGMRCKSLPNYQVPLFKVSIELDKRCVNDLLPIDQEPPFIMRKSTNVIKASLYYKTILQVMLHYDSKTLYNKNIVSRKTKILQPGGYC